MDFNFLRIVTTEILKYKSCPSILLVGCEEENLGEVREIIKQEVGVNISLDTSNKYDVVLVVKEYHIYDPKINRYNFEAWLQTLKASLKDDGLLVFCSRLQEQQEYGFWWSELLQINWSSIKYNFIDSSEMFNILSKSFRYKDAVRINKIVDSEMYNTMNYVNTPNIKKIDPYFELNSSTASREFTERVSKIVDNCNDDIFFLRKDRDRNKYGQTTFYFAINK